MSARYIAIDEEGYWLSNGGRIEDDEYAHELFDSLQVERNIFVTEAQGQKAIVEAFDAPYVARHIEKSAKLWTAHLPHDYRVEFSPTTLSLDEWDRFHARTQNGIPIVFARSAQMELFDAFDEFTDESVVIDGERLTLPPHLCPHEEVTRPQFWGEKYTSWRASGVAPRWDLGAQSAALKSIVPQLKIPKSRIVVVGSGAGHDTNYFYELGHIVTGLDFSEEAVNKARELYPENERRKFLQVDVLNLPQNLIGQFDVVFEHTFYCAINPQKRNAAVRSYSRLLHDQGHLLGIFMMIDKMDAPPFGTTEWELRQRLKTNFNFLYWTRWRHSEESRLGQELVTYSRVIKSY